MCKTSRFVVWSLVVLTLLAGFSGIAGAGPNKAVAGKGPVKGEITVWGWNIAASGLKDTVASFNKKYPGVKVNVVDIGRLDLYDKVTTALAANVVLPDVIQIESDHMAVYTEQFPNGFYDLTAVASKYVKDFDPSKWAQSRVGGKIRSIPWDSGPTGLFYRADYFAQAGINPDEIKTWDGMVEAGKKIEKTFGDKVKLLNIDWTGDDALYRMMMNQAGAFYFNEKGEVALGSDTSIKIARIIKSLKPYSFNTAGSWDTTVTATKNGTVASIPFGVWYSGTIMDQAPELKGNWRVMLLPALTGGGNRASNLGGSTLVIPATAKNPEAAWRFVENALATTQGQMVMLKKWGLFPSYLPTYEDSFFQEKQEFFGNQPIFAIFAGEVKDIPAVNYTGDFSKAHQYVINALTQILTQDADPEAVMRKAAKDVAAATGRKLAAR